MAHTDTVNSLNETINQSINRLFVGWRVGFLPIEVRELAFSWIYEDISELVQIH
jgi:hypothetical protein